MQVEATHETDIICKGLIGEAYEEAYKAYPADGMFSGIDKLWEKVEEALDRKGALDLCTTGAEDSEAHDILAEVFEEACRAALEDGHTDLASEYVDYKALWERVCAVIGVSV